jgi:DNA-binding GntR family transcriptional regulator
VTTEKAGEALPTVAQVAREYGVSGSTVSKVLRAIADDGLVRTIPR